MTTPPSHSSLVLDESCVLVRDVDALNGTHVFAEEGHGAIIQHKVGSLGYLRQEEKLLALTQRANTGTIVSLKINQTSVTMYPTQQP